MIKLFKRSAVAVVMAASATMAMAQFQPGMTANAVNAEIKAMKDAGASAEVVAAAAQAAGVSPTAVAAGMLSQGFEAGVVITAVVNASGDNQAVANAVVTVVSALSNITPAAVQQALASANPNLTAPSAAGVGTSAGTGAGTTGGTGFGGGFGTTPGSSLGGGGGGGVSRV